jgi:hypothetical protein
MLYISRRIVLSASRVSGGNRLRSGQFAIRDRLKLKPYPSRSRENFAAPPTASMISETVSNRRIATLTATVSGLSQRPRFVWTRFGRKLTLRNPYTVRLRTPWLGDKLWI